MRYSFVTTVSVTSALEISYTVVHSGVTNICTCRRGEDGDPTGKTPR